MKKLFLIMVSAAFAVTGCTSKEQDDKIKAFWADQQMKLMMKGSEASMKALSNPAAAEMLGKAVSMGMNFSGKGFAKEDMTDEERAEFEKMMKEMQSDMSDDDQDYQQLLADLQKMKEESAALAEQTKPTPQVNTSAKKPVAATKKTVVVQEPLEASLFLSPTCGWCQRLKKEGFAKKFQRKYNGKINLTEYTLNTSENNARFSRAVKKHRLSGGVPLLIIGDTPIQGYSEEMMKIASEAAEKELKKHQITVEDVAASKGPAILEVSMEDEEIKGPASAEDKKRMKELILSLQEFNGEMIQSLDLTFGAAVKNKGMKIAADTEKKLKTAANTSPDFQTFYTQYTKISKQNDAEMDKLMRQNADKIR